MAAPSKDLVNAFFGPDAAEHYRRTTAWKPVASHHSADGLVEPDAGVWLHKATVSSDTETADLWKLEMRLTLPMQPDPKCQSSRTVDLTKVHHYACEETANSKYLDLVAMANTLGSHLATMPSRDKGSGSPF